MYLLTDVGNILDVLMLSQSSSIKAVFEILSCKACANDCLNFHEGRVFFTRYFFKIISFLRFRYGECCWRFDLCVHLILNAIVMFNNKVVQVAY